MLLFPLSLLAQDKVMRVHKNTSDSLILVKYPQSIVIPVSDAMTYKWVLPDFDTARFFEASEALEATVTFKRIGTAPDPDPVVEKVDGEDPGVSYSTTWSKHSTTKNAAGQVVDIGWYKNTIAYSNVPESSVTYEFTGTKIELWAERKSSHGLGTVTISPPNGGEVIHSSPVTFADGTNQLPVKIYESPTLPFGKYSFALWCVNGYVLLDYFIVEK